MRGRGDGDAEDRVLAIAGGEGGTMGRRTSEARGGLCAMRCDAMLLCARERVAWPPGMQNLERSSRWDLSSKGRCRRNVIGHRSGARRNARFRLAGLCGRSYVLHNPARHGWTPRGGGYHTPRFFLLAVIPPRHTHTRARASALTPPPCACARETKHRDSRKK